MAATPEGYNEIPEEEQKKATAFFAKGHTLGGTGQYDYAIEMYIQGLTIDPEAVNAHQALREISMRRKASGGKPMGMREKWALKKGDDKQNMLNAEKMLAFDPGNTDNMLTVLESAQKAGFYDTVMWIGPMLLRANIDSPKPDFNKYIKLKNAYMKIGRYDKANEAIKYAVAMKPDDADLNRDARDLAATDAMKQGGYDKGGSFRDSVRDMARQKELMTQDTDVRTMDVLAQQITQAEAEYKADPNDSSKLEKLVDRLTKTDQAEYENKAIDLLDAMYDNTKAYRFRYRSHKIKMMQLARMERGLRQKAQTNPSDQAALKDYQDFMKDRYAQEAHIYQEAAENYPTDMEMRFNLGDRLFLLGRYDEAIPIFQQARNDPKFKVAATVGLGRSFLDAGFVDEAIETLKDLIESYEVKNDTKFTNMTYWYGRSLEKKGDTQAALKAYSSVAMANFNYLDVQARIKRLRAATTAPPEQK